MYEKPLVAKTQLKNAPTTTHIVMLEEGLRF